MRCGLGGLPRVVVTPFGRLGVGSNHQVEAASLAGSSGLGVGRHDIGRLNTLTEELDENIHQVTSHSPRVKLPGGYSRPALPSSVFNRPISCLPKPKQAAKKPKQEDVQLMYFMEKVTIRSINEFDPDKELLKNITTWLHLDRNMRLCTFS